MEFNSLIYPAPEPTCAQSLCNRSEAILPRRRYAFCVSFLGGELAGHSKANTAVARVEGALAVPPTRRPGRYFPRRVASLSPGHSHRSEETTREKLVADNAGSRRAKPKKGANQNTLVL